MKWRKQSRAFSAGRFGYTGQVWLPELGLQYSKARIYAPRLGRFMQADPIGYGDGLNLYNYVRSDPVNFTDPSGLKTTFPCSDGTTASSAAGCGNHGGVAPHIVVTGNPCQAGDGCFTYNGDLSSVKGPLAYGPGGVRGGAGERPQPPANEGGATPKQIDKVKKEMTKICAANPSGVECKKLKSQYFEILSQYHQQHPLPGIPKFRDSTTELGPLALGVLGCLGTFTSGANWVTAASCAYTARDIARFLVPEQERIP